jgi:biopolymer transport protein ExbD
VNIRFVCPQCGHRLKADEASAGSRALCTKCRTVVTVPAAQVAEASAASAAETRYVESPYVESQSAEPALRQAPDAVVRRREPLSDDEIDMTPMIDVVFQLLIFFMITAAFAMQKSLPVPVPQATSDAPQVGVPDDRDAITVRIDAENSLWVDGAQAVSRQDLIAKLRKLRGGANGRRTLLVSADPECRHESVVTALDAGSAAGMEEVELITDEEK